MSRRNKLDKFSEVLSFPNVYENYSLKELTLTASEGVNVDMKGRWASDHFNNQNPITLELACGRGEYTLALANKYPNRNYIGIDIKGARIWKGAKEALSRNLINAAFLRTRIEMLSHFFEPEEVDEIWITFPDPFLKKGKSNRRLTSVPFLDRYKKILKPGGKLHLKTDDRTLYDFSLETIASHNDYDIIYHSDDIYSKELFIPELAFKTYYENKHLENGLTIKFISAILK